MEKQEEEQTNNCAKQLDFLYRLCAISMSVSVEECRINIVGFLNIIFQRWKHYYYFSRIKWNYNSKKYKTDI